MTIQDLAYPIRVDAKGDLQLCTGYDNNVLQSLYFIIDNYIGTIPAFPDVGLPLNLFANHDDIILTVDLLMTEIPKQEPRIKMLDNVIVKFLDSERMLVEFDYYTYNSQVGHYSKIYYDIGV